MPNNLTTAKVEQDFKQETSAVLASIAIAFLIYVICFFISNLFTKIGKHPQE